MIPNTILLTCAVVLIASVVFVLLELLKTFKSDLGIAFRTKWGWLLISINLAVALGVYLAIIFAHRPLAGFSTAIIVGLTYPVLLRSRFTYFRQVGLHDDHNLTTLCLKIDEVYIALQAECLDAVDDMISAIRVHRARKLATRYSEVRLQKALLDLASARNNVSLEEFLCRHSTQLFAVCFGKIWKLRPKTIRDTRCLEAYIAGSTKRKLSLAESSKGVCSLN